MSRDTARDKGAWNAEALLGKAKKLGCSQAEVFETGQVTTPVNYENNELKSVQTAETAVVAVRVMKDGRRGFATSTRPGDDAVVEMAVRASQFGPPADLDFAPASPAQADLATYDPAVVDWSQEEMLAAGAGLVEAGRGLEPGVLASVTVEKSVEYTRVATSAGQAAWHEGTAGVLVSSVELVEPENMIQTWAFQASRRLADLSPSVISERVAWLYRNARHNVPFRGGSYPVVFSPAAVADLVAPLVACLNGKAVVKGESPWKDRLGDKLFADGFTLWDDPWLPWGIATRGFDDEGVPTSRRAVIEKGVLREFHLDLRSAKALGRTSTGNGFRPSPQTAPAPAPSNLALEPGSEPWAKLVTGVKEGLYVQRLMGAWAGNPYAGQVSGNVHIGFKIENGEIVGRVKDCMVLVPVFEAFRDALLALSRESEFAPPSYYLPHVLLDRVSVGTKS